MLYDTANPSCVYVLIDLWPWPSLGVSLDDCMRVLHKTIANNLIYFVSHDIVTLGAIARKDGRVNIASLTIWSRQRSQKR